MDALLESSFIDTKAEHHYELASLYAYMGDNNEAFAHLYQAFDHILILQDRLFTNPDFNELKNDDRWEGLLIRLGAEMGYDFMQE